MKLSESLAKKKLARREKRISENKRKKVGVGWDSVLKITRTGFKPRTKKEANAHQMKLEKKTGGSK